MTSTGLDQHIGDVGWLVASFVEGTADVADAIVVSSDGLLLAISPQLDRGVADKLAAIVSKPTSALEDLVLPPVRT